MKVDWSQILPTALHTVESLTGIAGETPNRRHYEAARNQVRQVDKFVEENLEVRTVRYLGTGGTHFDG